ncbi:MAG: hypothetical protein AAB543_06795 [Pseudomonadota bacterium]
MVETLSIIAILTAFVAVWFTAEVLKRLNHRSDPSKNPFVIALAQGLEQKDRWIVALDERVKALEGELRALRGGSGSVAASASASASTSASTAAGRRPLPEIERDLGAVARGLRKAQSLNQEVLTEPRPEQRIETRDAELRAALRDAELRGAAAREAELRAAELRAAGARGEARLARARANVSAA